MSVSQAVASHIPYLRRFARALSGSQASGDAYVVETLESIVKNPKPFQGAGDLRTTLYRTFLHVWNAAPKASSPSSALAHRDEDGARRNLDAIALRPRIAFLLSSLEGFDTLDVAKTLECSSEEAAALIQAANTAISDHIRTDVLIIEDEPFIALDLQTLVEDLGHHVIGIARTHKEAVKTIESQKPGLILADIQLADGSSGLEAVNQILINQDVPVIFITAYPERFLTGQPPEPAFLITKPFGVEALKAVIWQALFFDRRSRRAEAETGR